MKLSQRERMLLTILVVLLVACGIFMLGYMPLQDKIIANQSLIETQEIQKIIMNQQLSRYGKQDTEINELQVKANEGIGQIFQYRSNDQLDDLIRELAEKNKVTITQLSIADSEILAVDQYPFDEEVYLTYPIEEYLKSLYGVSTIYTENQKLSDVYLIKNTVIIQFTSNYDVMGTMIDQLRSLNTTIFVESATAKETTTKGIYNITLEIGVYSHEEVK